MKHDEMLDATIGFGMSLSLTAGPTVSSSGSFVLFASFVVKQYFVRLARCDRLRTWK